MFSAGRAWLATEHLPLDHVATDALGEAHQRSDPALLCTVKPGIELLWPRLAHHVCKLLRQGDSGADVRADATQPAEMLLVGLVQGLGSRNTSQASRRVLDVRCTGSVTV